MMKEARQFLEVIRPKGRLIVLAAMLPDRGAPKVMTYELPDEIREALAWMNKIAALGCNIYHQHQHVADRHLSKLRKEDITESNYPPAKPGALIGEPLKAARRGVIAPPSNSKPHSCVGAHEISMYYLVPRIQSHPPSPNEIWKAPTLPIVFCSRFHTRRHTPGNVKLLLPPRQSRGISLKGVSNGRLC